jgi:hypothetical protein
MKFDWKFHEVILEVKCDVDFVVLCISPIPLKFPMLKCFHVFYIMYHHIGTFPLGDTHSGMQS